MTEDYVMTAAQEVSKMKTKIKTKKASNKKEVMITTENHHGIIRIP